MMRVYYLTLPSLLDVSLCFVNELTDHAMVRMTVQVNESNLDSSFLPANGQRTGMGLTDGSSRVIDTNPQIKQICAKLNGFQIANFGKGNVIYPGSIRTSLDVLKDIKDFQPDIIHFETTSGRMMWTLPALRKIAPVVITVHDPHPHSGESTIKKWLIRSYTYQQVDRYILHNKTQLDQFCAEYRVPLKNVDYTPLGEYHIYPGFLNGSEKREPIHVLFFGRLSPYKGVEILLKAIPEVSKRMADAHFVIAGRPIPGYKLPPLPDVPNGGRIELKQDYISNQELASLFQRTALVVCPYIDATQSGVVMTAYAFNKPVVASKTGGLPEYVSDGQTGCLVTPSDYLSLADGIVSTLQTITGSIQGREKFQSSIRDACKNVMNWRLIANQTMSIYKKTLSNLSRR